MKAILKADNLNKTFQLSKENTMQVLKGVSLSINEGEFVSIMGASGSGKSTLLYNISGMDKPTSGRVMLNGEEMNTLSEKELAHLRLTKMGFVFQQNNLLKNLSLLDNIIISAYLSKNEDKKVIDQRANALMSQTGISHLKDSNINQASGGELQRTSICRALINKPEIIFADEPTGSLNSSATIEVMNIFTELNNAGSALLIVTHDAQVAARSERVLFMKDGQIEGEYRLGKLTSSDDLKQREADLTEWLISRGF